MPRFQIEVDEPTYQALCALAEKERRKPAGQAEWMLQQAIEWRLKHQTAMRHLEGVPTAIPSTENEG